MAAALAESEARFHNAFHYTTIGMALVARDGHYLQVNPAFCQQLGYTEAELCTMTFQTVTHPDDRTVNAQAMHALLDGTLAAYQTEKRYLHRDGTVIWGHLSTSLARDRQGQPLYFVSQFQDITARKYAELAVQASERRFRAIAESASEAIIVADGRGTIVLWNAGAAAMFGYQEAEVVGRPFLRLFPAQDRAAYEAVLAHTTATDTADRTAPQEWRAQRKDGGVFPISMSVGGWQADGQAYHSAIIRDVTARKQAEAALAAQVRRAEAAQGEARAILDATDEGMVLLAPDGRCLSANRRFAELFGLDRRALLGRHVGDFAGDLDRVFDLPDVAGRLATSLAALETDITLDLRQRTPVERDLTLFSPPVRAAGGAVLGRLFVFRDVTQERAADRLQEEFVAHVSHELRTPLTSIKGYTDLLLNGDAGALTAEQREFLEIVQHNADREVTLVNELLDLARLEAGGVALERRALDLVPLLRRVAASMRPQVAAKRQRLTLDLPPALPPVAGDAARLAQVFTNLLSNAHKYTPAGGQIALTAASEEACVRVAVRDSGVGLSEEEQTHLFTKFYRAKNRATQEVAGTGLGLAITRALVERHEGTITVTSAPGAGSTFSVTLLRCTATPTP